MKMNKTGPWVFVMAAAIATVSQGKILVEPDPVATNTVPPLIHVPSPHGPDTPPTPNRRRARTTLSCRQRQVWSSASWTAPGCWARRR